MIFSALSAEYKKYVLEDLKQFGSVRRPVKASAVERLTTKTKSPLELHANPDDEFSIPTVGPNEQIVSNYMSELRKYEMEEPLLIEKLYPDGYMLQNGHHRWLAALQIGLDKVPVKLINLVHADDVKRMLQNIECDKRAAFDLDEVLWIQDDEMGSVPEEKADGFFFERKYRKRLRQYAPFLLQELNRMGYDIWVYTAGYYSVEEIEDFFKHYDVHIHGIVNGAKRGRKYKKAITPDVKASFASRYKENIHVDTEHVLRVIPESNDYDYITLDPEEPNWALSVLKTVRGFQES